MDQHPSKRALRPTTSLPTTAETYGQKHGIDPNLTLALQNIGRRGRQTQPSFARTSTAPVVSFNSPAPGGFQTSHEIMDQAKGIVNIEAWRSSTRELRPYGSTSSVDGQFILGAEGESSGRRYSAGDGFVAGSGVGVGGIFEGRGMKRAQEGEGDAEEEGTEVDEDEFQEGDTTDGNENQNGGTGDFPPVFQSANLSQPELFHSSHQMQTQPGTQKQTRFAVPPLPDRLKRGLPARRMLAKSVSAPVGRLGGMGMDVDMDGGKGEGEMEDGFDVREWAAKEDF